MLISVLLFLDVLKNRQAYPPHEYLILLSSSGRNEYWRYVFALHIQKQKKNNTKDSFMIPQAEPCP